jgi:PAS domain S-box-containing protein
MNPIGKDGLLFNDNSNGQPVTTFLTDFFEISFSAVIAFDAKEQVAFWNPAAEQIYGWMSGEALGKTFPELFGMLEAPDGQKVQSLRLSELKRGETVQGEYSPYRKDGSQITVEYKIRAISGKDDAILGYVSIHRDLTERRRIENEVIQLAKLPAENPNPVMRVTPDGGVLYANEASQQLLKFWEQQTGETIAADVRTAINEAFETGSKKMIEVVYEGKMLSCTLAPIQEAGYVNFYGNDITDRKKADEVIGRLNAELQTQLGENNALIDMLPIGIWTGNQDCSVVTGNPAAYHILGLPPGINASFTDPDPEMPVGVRLFVEGEEVKPEDAPMQTVARTGRPMYNIEHEFLFLDQTRKTVLASIVPVFDQEGEVRKVIAAYADLTERKQTQARLWLLSHISEMVRQMADPDEFLYAVARAVGEHLLVKRSFFAEIDQANDRGFIWKDYFQDMPSIAGKYRLSDYSAEAIREMEAGHTVVNRDAQLDPRTSTYYEKTYKPNGERSYVAVPLLRDGHFVAALWVSTDQPRDWSTEEVTLLEAVAERAWLAVEKMRLDLEVRHERELLQKIFDTIPVMITRYKPDTGVLNLNQAFERTIGWTTAEVRDMDLMAACYPNPEYRQEVRQFMEALPGGWKDILMTTRDGRVIQTTWTNLHLSDDAQVGIGLDITQRKQAEEQLRQARERAEQYAGRLARLQTVTAALSAALTPEEVADVVIHQGLPVLGAASGTIAVLSEDGQELRIVQFSSDENVVRPFKTYPLSLDIPAAQAVRSGEPVWIESQKKYLERYPHLEKHILAWGHQTAVAIPMTVGERTLGVLTLSFEQKLPRTVENMGFALNLALQGAQALERARLYQAEQQARQAAERAADRTTRLQQITAVLTRTSGSSTFAQVAVQQGILASGASAGMLVVLMENGQELRVISAQGYPPEAVRMEPFPLTASTPVTDSLRARQPVWIHSQNEFAVKYPSISEIRGEFGNEATAVLPLSIGDHLLGGMVFSFTEKQDFERDERDFFLAIAQECADGLERASAEDALRKSEKRLQILNESLEQRVREQTAEVRKLASDLTKAEQRERHRIAHILHEDLQQRIYAIQMQVEFMLEGIDITDPTLQGDFDKIKKQLNEVVALTRHLSVDLSPPILRDEGLRQALEWLASQMQEQHSLRVELHANDPFIISNRDIHLLLFGSVRELLFNVVKHAGVKQATVSLQRLKGKLRVEVRDNGKGFNVGSLAWSEGNKQEAEESQLPQASFGLPTIRHRLSLFGGHVLIRSRPGVGTVITLIVPVPQ